MEFVLGHLGTLEASKGRRVGPESRYKWQCQRKRVRVGAEQERGRKVGGGTSYPLQAPAFQFLAAACSQSCQEWGGLPLDWRRW